MVNRSLLLIGSLLLLAGSFPERPIAEKYELASASRIWLEGRSTVDRFTCRATDFRGTGEIRSGTGVRVSLAVPVRELDCGRRRMNSDLQEALRADRHPEITFLVQEVVPAGEVSTGRHRFQVHGQLRMAGVTRPVTFIAVGKEDAGGRLRGSGSIDLRMTDFGIDPPTALLGLVRAHDEITVHFDLIAAPA